MYIYVCRSQMLQMHTFSTMYVHACIYTHTQAIYVCMYVGLRLLYYYIRTYVYTIVGVHVYHTLYLV